MKEREVTTRGAIRSRVMEIYGGKCANSDDPRFDHRPGKTPSLHHIIFKSDHGLTEKGNLIPLCKACHTFLHRKIEEMSNGKTNLDTE